MDYDLTGLGSRSFEHMIQALCVASIGAGTVVFGDGSDGGREATHRGSLTLPEISGHPHWAGYTVIQAKHRMHAATPTENATWLIRELRDELDQFLPVGDQPPKRTRKPNNYLLVTNVRLSSKEDRGGIDRVDDVLATYARKLDFDGYAVWSYDQICRLLDAHDGVRRTYAGAVTSGDLIATLLELFDDRTHDIGTRLSVNAMVELQARQWVRLGEAGLEHEGKLSLDRVAVDVPALIVDPAKERSEWTETKVINHILLHGSESKRKTERGASAQGIVVVGGPGQGKSTVAQIVCQAYRTSILRGSAALKQSQLTLVQANKSAIDRMGVDLPTYRRWPMHVELSKFGDAIAADENLSLLTFIASEIKAGGKPVLANELVKWRKTWPWLLVLDGLDEVASLNTRARVVRAISEFLTEVDFLNDDVLVVATTRPQGYKGELGEIDPEQVELRPLTPAEAGKYGKLLVRARLYDDVDLARQVMARLDVAAGGPITARLMTSPLQVTIMETLLEGVQRVPETRHALFDEYYKSIYRREEAKAGNLGDLLAKRKDVIDYVHEQVGLYLHVRAELDGQSEAVLADSELKALFVARLKEDGHENSGQLATELMRAAKDRVVLLVPSRADHVGFEVRSLQEYMAARAIVNGSETVVLDRLDVIAPSTHWRNAWLLAAGRLFSRTEHQRDALLGRVRNLDTNTAVGMVVGIGERLALDMLEDEFGASVPRLRRALISHALSSLEQWADPQLRRLASVLASEYVRGDKITAGIIKGALTKAFESTGAGKASAVVILRSWDKMAGPPGALSRLLLSSSNTWRPNGHPTRKRVNIAEVIEPLFRSVGFNQAQLDARSEILRLLRPHSVNVDVTASEAATYAKNFQQAIAPEFQALLEDEAVMESLIDVIGEVNATDGEAAIFVRQLIVTLSERQVVGTDSRISAPSAGLFALDQARATGLR